MRNHHDLNITGEELTDASNALVDAVAERIVRRPLSETRRRELEAIVHSQITGIAEDIRKQLVSENQKHAVERSGRRTVWTPPELAREWGVSPDKILGWIRSGELPATNIAVSQSSRPRYRIDAEAVAAFRVKRSVHPPPPISRLRRKPAGDVIEFF